jgi:hypothetical protein
VCAAAARSVTKFLHARAKACGAEEEFESVGERGVGRLDPMRNPEAECGVERRVVRFGPMPNAEEECGMRGRAMRRE